MAVDHVYTFVQVEECSLGDPNTSASSAVAAAAGKVAAAVAACPPFHSSTLRRHTIITVTVEAHKEAKHTRGQPGERARERVDEDDSALLRHFATATAEDAAKKIREKERSKENPKPRLPTLFLHCVSILSLTPSSLVLHRYHFASFCAPHSAQK